MSKFDDHYVIDEERESSRGLATDLTGRNSSKAKLLNARYSPENIKNQSNNYSHYRKGLTSIMLARRQQQINEGTAGKVKKS